MIKQKPVTLGVIQGGKDDEPVEPKLNWSGPKGPDWLRELGYGARFVCHLKSQPNPIFLTQYGVAFVLDECILIAQDVSGMGLKLDWVISKNFSQAYKLVAVLPQPDEEAGNNERYLPRPTDGKDHD